MEVPTAAEVLQAEVERDGAGRGGGRADALGGAVAHSAEAEVDAWVGVGDVMEAAHAPMVTMAEQKEATELAVTRAVARAMEMVAVGSAT